MKVRPMLFSAPMVRALLDGSKTQTRRVVKPQPYIDAQGNACWNGSNFGQDSRGPLIKALASPLPSSKTKRVHCPYGAPGDRLWVRETWALDDEDNALMYRADLGFGGDADDWERNRLDGAPRFRWKPSIHMPRTASRITLEITGVRVERLQDISERDAMAEGVKNSLHLPGGNFARENFEHLWWSINGEGSWETNPWVWVVEFKKVNQ
jgi:hypothetical protein